MQNPKAPEFDLARPLSSALAAIRAVVLSPRIFFSNLPAEGRLREPVLFVLLVGTITGVLGAVVALISNVATGGLGPGDLRAAVLERFLFALLTPGGVAVAGPTGGAS